MKRRKCTKCFRDIEYKGAFDTVDGVRYEEYVCKRCRTVVLGEKIDDESS